VITLTSETLTLKDLELTVTAFATLRQRKHPN